MAWDLTLDTPSLGANMELNLTAQEWKWWRSRWARYKPYTRRTDKHACMYHLWGCFSLELKTAFRTEGMAANYADLSEEQFLERVWNLVVSTSTLQPRQLLRRLLRE